MFVSHETAFKRLMGFDNILLLTHRQPDGDAMGSVFALYLALTAAGKNAAVSIGRLPHNLEEFAPAGAYKPDFVPEHIVCADVGDRKLLERETGEKYGGIAEICIDHHGVNVPFAEITLLDADASAACEVIYDMLTEAEAEITPDIAKMLYIGIATDTGCFRYSNTTPKTMRTAAALMETGIDTDYINTAVFETKTKSWLVFRSLAMSTLKMYCEDRIAVVTVSADMYEKSGADESDTAEINSIPRQIEGVLCGITVKEQPGGKQKISVRTKSPLDAAAICRTLGGGGHPRAAGCELEMSASEATAAVVAVARKMIEPSDDRQNTP